MSEDLNTDTSTQKVKTLSVFIPTAAILVLSAMLATPWLAAVPAYAGGDDDDDKCKKDKKDDKCKKDDDKKKKKVTICHAPPGNPDNAKTITVGENAAKAHLKNHEHDKKGPCDKKKDDDKKDDDKCKCDDD
jgi:hypothetical protein